MDLGLLVIRIVLGGLLAGHGIQKLFGRLGGFGLNGTGGYLEMLGLRPGRLFAALAGVAELAGGALLVFGFATPLASLLIASTMFVAVRTDHAGKGLWVFNGGAEYALVVAAIAVSMTIIGPGTFSADRALGLQVSGAPVGVATLIAAGIAAVGVLSVANRGASGTAVPPDAMASSAMESEGTQPQM